VESLLKDHNVQVVMGIQVESCQESWVVTVLGREADENKLNELHV